MTVERINLRLSNCDWNSAACKTVDVLRKGGIVVVPTETVYGLAARLADSRAVNKLIQLKGRNENHPFALAFPSVDTISDVCSEMSPLAFRLARRCMPGPVSLVLDVSPGEGMFWNLPPEVQKAVSLQSTVCCRVPDHPLLLTVLGELNEPIVLTSANKSGHGENASVEQIIDDLDGIDLLLDEGSLVSPKPSTIVKIVGNEYSILREGAIKSETVKRLAALMVLFVCTANVCRSPMAEYLCEKLLAERLRCPMDALEEHGIVVLSAGLVAGEGQSASANAAEVMSEYGIDLRNHRSLLLSETHVRFADFIFTMTRTHREKILSSWHNVDSRLSVLRTDGGDIIDPIGSSIAAYRACAEQIQKEIARRLDDIQREVGV